MPTAAARQDSREADAPELFGQYLLHESLGRGSTASVRRGVLCRDAGFRREVALKQLHAHLAELPAMVELFTREARLGSYLRHANIAQTFDFGSFNGTYFIAMELVRGPTLAQLARQCAGAAGPIPMGIVVGILTQLCDAFDYIRNACDPHGQPLQLAHCDVSPTNVVIANTGFVKLIDFGISRAASARPVAETGMLRRRLAYVAPEYAAGKLDARSDLFSLGVIGHELISNQPLFAGSGNELRRVCEMPIPPLARSGTVPHALQEVIMTALQRDPDRRWQAAADMRSALADVARGMSIHIGPPQIASWVAWAFSQRARPEGPTPLLVVPANASPAALHARAASEGGAFQDAPTTLRHGIRMPAGLLSSRRSRSRWARPPSASVPTSPAITREFTKRFLRLAALRRRPAVDNPTDDEPLRRQLAHTVPHGRMALRLPGVADVGDERPERPERRDRRERPDRRERADRPNRADRRERADRPTRADRPDRADRARWPSAAAPSAPIPLASSSARNLPLPLAAPAEPPPNPPVVRIAPAPAPEPMRTAPPATARPSAVQRVAVAAPPLAAPTIPPPSVPSFPRASANSTGVLVVPASPSRRPDRGAARSEQKRRTRMIRLRWRLPHLSMPVVVAILAAFVAFALAYHWLRH